MFFDPLYILFALPGLILASLASMYVNSTFKKYSRERTYSGLTGAEAARRMLMAVGITDVMIERTSGMLSDHYDPTSKTLRLSDGVYNSQSIAAVGVACHEAGHAIQHAENYGPLALRTMLVLPASLGSNLAYFIIIIGAVLQAGVLVQIGLVLFGLAVLFTLVTLPVEWNASSRAKRALLTAGFCLPDEQEKAATVLNAAFLTYVAAAASAIMTLLYYIVRFSGRDRD